VYEKDYKPEHMRCNKLNTVKDADNKILEVTRKSNSTFFCQNKEDSEPKLMIHNKGEFLPITFDELKNYKNIEKYNTVSRDWAKTGISEEELLKQDGGRAQFFGGTVPVPNNNMNLKIKSSPDFTRTDLVLNNDPKPEYEALGEPL
jgi:hypothetical protein